MASQEDATKREILSLVGILQHAAKVIRPGRTFVGHMYEAAAKVQELDYFTRLNTNFRSELYWWHIFITHWNGTCFLPLSTPTLSIQTDASGLWGGGGFFNGKWFQIQWQKEWVTQTIMAKEVMPIVVSCATWGCYLSKQSILFQCDNTGVMAAIKKGSIREPVVMNLLRTLWFFVAHFDITLHIEHIAGMCNCAADPLSRNNLSQFFLSCPQADHLPSPVPHELYQILAVNTPDWTSPHFIHLFNTITSLIPRLSDRKKATKGWGEEKVAASESLVSTVLQFIRFIA